MHPARTLALIGALCLAAVAIAGESLDDLKQALQSRYPSLHIYDIRPAPVVGWYEVYTGDRVVYSDRSGDHLFVGQLVDTKTRDDMTAVALTSRQAIDFNSLPLAKAIKTVHGNGRQRIAIFADPDCPYCQKLETDLAQLTDITVYTFLFPIEGLHPGARVHARAIWCAKDPSTAWREWMLIRQEPPEPAHQCSDKAIDDVVAYGESLQVVGTPTLFFEDGHRESGMPPPGQLAQLLGRAPAAAQPTAAAGSSEGKQSAPGTGGKAGS